MERRNLFLIAFAVLALAVAGTQAKVDCTQPPPFVHPAECCPMPNMITDDIDNKCSPEKLAMKTKGKPMKLRYPCMHACFLNETGIMVNGEFDKATMDKYIKSALSTSPKMMPIIQSAFPKCYRKATKIVASWEADATKKETGRADNDASNSSDSNESTGDEDDDDDENSSFFSRQGPPPPPPCPPLDEITMQCTFDTAFLECPKDIWTNTGDCNKLREHMKTCRPEE